MDRIVQAWASRSERAVIFDFNGTLSDDEPVLCRIFGDIFAGELGWAMSEADYYARLAGLSDREIIETVVAEVAGGDERLVDVMLRLRQERYAQAVAAAVPVTDGAVALVRLLAAWRVPLAIVTGAQRADVELVVHSAGLAGCFDVLVTEEDVAHGKPDPEGFLAAAEQLGVDPADVLVFEDSVVGARAARAAGMQCLAVAGTSAAKVLRIEADGVVRALTPELFLGLGEGVRDAG